MTADIPTATTLPKTIDISATAGLSQEATPEIRFYRFLLAYRWMSLLPPFWFLLTTTDTEFVPVLLFAIALGSTFVATIVYLFSGHIVFQIQPLLGADTVYAVILLLLSHTTDSPYYLYALSPLLAGAFLFQLRGALLTGGFFTAFYLLALFITGQTNAISLESDRLLIQLGGVWLITGLCASLLALKRLREAHEALAITHAGLARQKAELETMHHQLEVIHELTLFLQASEVQVVQQRLLKAVTEKLGFSKAVAGLVNSNLQRLEGWEAWPHISDISPAAAPLPLTPESGSVAQAALNRQVQWCPAGQPLVANETLEAWLSQGVRPHQKAWLILPMVWQEQIVGVLLVTTETMAPVSMADDRWAILTSLVSQAAVALGVIDRTHSLAVEQERNRIARDIHDTVAQSLFGIIFSLDACIKMLPDQVQSVQQELVELRDLAVQVRREMRQSILNIWPSELTQEQFKADLSKYVAYCSPAHVFHVDFTIEGDFDGLPALIRRTLYRVCQEALTNAARHSGVDKARVYLYVEAAEVYLSIRDKGRGFDPRLALSRERSREQFGLRGMRERIEALGGTCDILSQAGQGTQVIVQVPLKRRDAYGC